MICKKLTHVLAGATLTIVATAISPIALAENYKLDPGHSFVSFKIQHLGFSVMQGRFNELEGAFSYDEADPGSAEVSVTIKTDSVDTNHAKRDKHLRDEDFLNVSKYPEATFKSTKFEEKGETATLEGVLTLHGVARPVMLDVQHVGHGKDPWGGYRRGFSASTTIKRSDFDMSYDLGPASDEMHLEISIEGIRES
jgi:polyisoprenoid-binding protein YceI